jgi:DNA repair protein SbcD/Mre11
MRLLHTGDWHLGKRLYGADRSEEARAALDEVAGIAADERVDAVLVAGDLLDRRLVDSAALGDCLTALERLAGIAPVVAVTGNHDDPDLWDHLAPYLRGKGIHVVGNVRGPADGVQTLATAAGPLHVGLMPWRDPARMALEAGANAQAARGRYADRVAAMLEALGTEAVRRRREDGGVAVLLGHVLVDRAAAGGGERELTMGIAYAVSPHAIPVGLDYVALGHVHRPQTLPGVAAPGRYCGSPMALDFSEDNHAKCAVVVEVDGDTTRAREVPLAAARPLVRLRGRIDDLPALASAHPGAWFACEVLLDAPVTDLVRQVREAVPAALRVEPVYAAPVGALPEAGEGGGDDPARDLPALYAEWTARQGRELAPVQARAFAMAVAEAAEDPEA